MHLDAYFDMILWYFDLKDYSTKYSRDVSGFNIDCNLVRFAGIYEIFCGHKNFYIGRQPEPFPGTETVSSDQHI